MAAPITPVPDDCSGHIITIFGYQAAIAAADTFTIPDGLPTININKAHPVLSIGLIAIEADADVSDSKAGFTPAKEMIRAAAATGAGEWSVATNLTVNLYNDADKNAYYFLTYHAAGSKLT